MSGPRRIRYRFDLPDGSQERWISISIRSIFACCAHPWRIRRSGPPSGSAVRELPARRSGAARIARRRCRWSPAIEPLKALVSFDTVGVTVMEAERTVYAETSAQQAMSSVLGLIMATAGCPWTDRLRPMARFHLPFASEAETVYRSICMFLLAREISGAEQPPGFAALEELYRNLHVVNRDMSRRLGAATRTDPARNAMALLDSYTTLLPAALECSLEELRPLFDAWETRENFRHLTYRDGL